MPFDLDKLERAKLEPRRARVTVQALAPFFTGGDDPAFEVRGLTATELHRAIEAGKRQSSIESIVKAIAATGDQAAAVRRALGLSTDTPGEIAKRLEMLVLGTVAPKIDLPHAVKIAEGWPIEFLTITNEIADLTGKGADVGKPVAASQTIPA